MYSQIKVPLLYLLPLLSLGYVTKVSSDSELVSKIPTDNESVIDGSAPRGQYNRVAIAISGTILEIVNHKNVNLYKIDLEWPGEKPVWVSHFFGGTADWIKVDGSVKIYGVFTDIRNNVPLWGAIQSDHLMAGFCIVDSYSGEAFLDNEICRNWGNTKP